MFLFLTCTRTTMITKSCSQLQVLKDIGADRQLFTVLSYSKWKSIAVEQLGVGASRPCPTHRNSFAMRKRVVRESVVVHCYCTWLDNRLPEQIIAS